MRAAPRHETVAAILSMAPASASSPGSEAGGTTAASKPAQ
jgi:hypothetical protein